MRWAPDRARRGHWHARRLKFEFATDSPLEGDGFEPSVPGRETVNPIVGDGTACSKMGGDLLGIRKFESISLQR
jgi:hypothetical protein